MLLKYTRQKEQLEDDIKEQMRQRVDKSSLLHQAKHRKIVIHYMEKCRERIDTVMQRKYAVEQLNVTAMQIEALQHVLDVPDRLQFCVECELGPLGQSGPDGRIDATRQEALDVFANSTQVTLGGNLGIALGPIGRNIEGAGAVGGGREARGRCLRGALGEHGDAQQPMGRSGARTDRGVPRRSAGVRSFKVMDVVAKADTLARSGKKIYHLEDGQPQASAPSVSIRRGAWTSQAAGSREPCTALTLNH